MEIEVVVKVVMTSVPVTGLNGNAGETVVVAAPESSVDSSEFAGAGLTVTAVVCTRYDVKVVSGETPLSQLVVPF